VAAGQGIVSIDFVRRMIDEPDFIPDLHLQKSVFSVPSHGLYLASVEYDEKGHSNTLLLALIAEFVHVPDLWYVLCVGKPGELVPETDSGF